MLALVFMTAFEKIKQGLASRIAEERKYQEINTTTPLPPIISAKEFREKMIVRPPEIINEGPVCCA
jgi:hypothetical protein